MSRRSAVVLGIAILVGGCQSGTANPTTAPTATAVALPSAPSATLAAPTSAPTVAPEPTRPAAWPRPTDLPIDGACDDGHSCMGLLKPGTAYRTSVFEPVTALSVQSPDWENLAEEGGVFDLTSIRWPGDIVRFFREPQAVDDGVGRTVPELAAWLASNPRLKVTAAKAVKVGGLTGVTLDIRVAPGASSDTFGCEIQVCVNIFKGVDPDPHDPYFWTWDWGSGGPETQRLYLLTLPKGVIAIFVDSIDGTTFDEITSEFDKIKPTLKFG